MRVTFFGTRGSVPVSGPDKVKAGGNTTCLRVESPCLPKGWSLAVDAGSGFVPFSAQVLAEGAYIEVHVLQTHYHFDHLQGLLLSPLLYRTDVPLTMWGPLESGFGPREVLKAVMRPPFHPVDLSKIGSHLTCREIECPDARILIVHPYGGGTMQTLEEYERGNGMVKFGKKGEYPRKECLVIRMLYSNHPERTITYRFEENPTGKVFVFLTDHENTDTLSMNFKRHLENADLLVMDSQYPRKKYELFTAGFGHGTPDYCVRTAVETGAKRLGLTHHDPMSSDKDIEQIVLDAYSKLDEYHGKDGLHLTNETIFACRDYQVVDL